MNDATVKFGYDGRELYAGLAAQERKMRGSAQSAQSIFSRLGGGIQRSMGSMFAGVGVAAVTAFTKSALQSFADIADGAKRLNTSAESYQRLATVAKGNATDIDTLAASLLRMRRQLQDDPAGELAAGLEEAGIAAADFLRLDAEGQVLALADAFQRAGKDGTQLPLLTDALGKSYAELIPLLKQGRGALRGMLEESFAVSEGMITAADEINNRWDSMTGKMLLAGKILTVGTARGMAEALGLMPRTQVDPTGGQKEQQRRQQADEQRREDQRDAEAARVQRMQEQAMKKRVDIVNAEISKKRELLALEHVNVEILELQARGQDRLAEKAQKHERIRQRAQQLSAMGLDANAAIALAQREEKARAGIDYRMRTGRTKIGGVKNRRMMGFGGLDELARMQQKTELPLDVRTPAGVRGARIGADGHFYGGYAPVNVNDLASRGRRPGRMMGETSAFGALSTRAAVSTSSAQASGNAAPSRDSGAAVPDKLEDLINITRRGFFGR